MNQLVKVKNIDPLILEQIKPSAPYASRKQYWGAKVPIVWRETDLFCCPVCKRVYYKRNVEIVVVKIMSIRKAPNQYISTTTEEQSSLYWTALCPHCATKAGKEWRINRKLLVLIP